MDATIIFQVGVKHLERLKNTAKHLAIAVVMVGTYHLDYSLEFQYIKLYERLKIFYFVDMIIICIR